MKTKYDIHKRQRIQTSLNGKKYDSQTISSLLGGIVLPSFLLSLSVPSNFEILNRKISFKFERDGASSSVKISCLHGKKCLIRGILLLLDTADPELTLTCNTYMSKEEANLLPDLIMQAAALEICFCASDFLPFLPDDTFTSGYVFSFRETIISEQILNHLYSLNSDFSQIEHFYSYDGSIHGLNSDRTYIWRGPLKVMVPFLHSLYALAAVTKLLRPKQSIKHEWDLAPADTWIHE